jgi:acetolactate synthase I/II/III large subunit
VRQPKVPVETKKVEKMTRTVADTIVAALRRHGIDVIFAQSNPPSLLLAAEEAGIRQLFYRTENAGGAMADGFSRISGRISVIAVQNGPAATLVVAPMSEALKASIPMLVLVQETPATMRDRNAFQEFDHSALFSGVSKWTRCVSHPSRVADYLDQAITVATSGRPGPVALLLPTDLLDMPDQPAMLGRHSSFGTFPRDRVRPDSSAVSRAAELIAKADTPIVIAGGGVHISGASTELDELLETGFLPAATTNMGKGSVSDNSPWSLGVAANIAGKNGPTHFHLPLIAEADVVLLIGTRTNQNGTDSWTLTSADATYIHIDIDGLEIGRNYESVRLAGDAKAALADLNTALKSSDLRKRRHGAPALRERIARARQRHREAIAPLVRSDRAPIAPERLLSELDSLLGPEDIVVADASYASVWINAYLTAKRAGQRFLLPRGQAGLGWGLPLAIGAKLASPGSRVIAVVGDGGFAHVWSELETAVREHTPVVVIVLNNGLLAMQRHGENVLFGRTTTAIRFRDVDHAAIARAVGARSKSISDPKEIRESLIEALEADVCTLLDVLVDPNAHAPVRWLDGHELELNRQPNAQPR